MSQGLHAEVFTVGELATAAGVSPAYVLALLNTGQIQPIPGTQFISWSEAIRSAPQLRALAAASHVPPSPAVLAPSGPAQGRFEGIRGARLSAVGSSLVHAFLLVCVAWLTTMNVDTAVEQPRPDESVRMIFLVTPGPGGGGGGGGARTQRPAVKLERRGSHRSRISVPEVTPKPAVVTNREVETPRRPTPVTAAIEPKPAAAEPEPLPARILVAPVVTPAAESRDRAGVMAGANKDSDSRGPGEGVGAGSGRGNGNGEGLGGGIGPGSGGGTGGGPYRPGSGITPPRLLHEVKAVYTETARRQNLTGEVLMEIVVRHDGTVGDVRITRGLGAGLDQRAVDAVRQWRFEPARRQGTPVDVLVEVAVEFTLR